MNRRAKIRIRRKKRMRRRVRFIGFILVVMLIVFVWNNKLFVEGNINNKDTNEAGKTFKIVIDPGHGGSDVGAIGTSGLYEKDFTLSLSKKIKKILEKEEHIEVYMTRDDDTFISTEDLYRPKFANELNADLYISIHGNTFRDSNVSGAESFYFHDESKYFAELIHSHVVNATGFNDRGVKTKDFFVVRYADMPAVLLEIGYLTNPQEEQKMMDDGFQYSIATSIVDGIKEYLEIE